MTRKKQSSGTSKGKQPLSGTALKQFRSQVAIAKKKGFVSKRVDARKQAPTKYMRGKLNKFADVIRGEAIALKTPKLVREQYAAAGIFESRGNRSIVPIEKAGQRASIKKGKYIQVVTPLKNGEFRVIKLPLKNTDLPGFIRYLRENPTVDGLKEPEDQFSFRLYGHNVRGNVGFIDAAELASYVEQKYQHLFKPAYSREAVAHLQLGRFREYMPEPNESERIYNRGSKPPAERQRGKPGPKPRLKPIERGPRKRDKARAELTEYQLTTARERDRLLKAKQSRKMTPAQIADKRERNTSSQAASRARKKTLDKDKKR